MSVINKMLQDLDNKAAEQTPSDDGLSYQRIQVEKKTSKVPNSLRLALVLIASTLFAFTALWWFEPKVPPTAVEKKVVKKRFNNAVLAQVNTIEKPKDVEAEPATLVVPEPTVTSAKVDPEKTSTAQKPLDKVITPSTEQPAVPVAAIIEKPQETLDDVVAKSPIPTPDPDITVADMNKTAKFSISKNIKDPEKLAQRALKKGSDAYVRGRFALAETEFKKALNLKPDLHEARAQWVGLLFGEKNLQKAMTILQQGINQFPNNTPYRLLAARIWLDLQQPKMAFSVLQNHVPNERVNNFYQLKAAVAQQEKQWQSALDSWQALLSHNTGKQVGAWQLGMAIALEQLGQQVQAKSHFQQALAFGLPMASKEYALARLASMEPNDD